MQKFKAKFKNVPTDAPQVCSSTNSVLNKDQSLSVQNKVLTLNNLEVDLPQHKVEKSLRVSSIAYVLNKRGQPLMPCSARKARVLLKKGEASVVKSYKFFVIQLKKATGEQVQVCSLGIDSGYGNIGFSVIDRKKEIVTGELGLDQKTSERLLKRKQCRKFRRNRLWYRKQRFNNRKINKGWLPPSIQRRFDTHLSLIKNLKSILPEGPLAIEVGNFDIQKIENPDIKGIQYQQGSLFEYQNMRSFLMAREHGRCQLCCKDFKNNPSHIHHIISRDDGGTDKQDNLALLHKKCHERLHKQKLFNLLKKNKQYKDATFMNIIRWKFREELPECKIVYGNETFVKRNELRLEKSHCNDAFVIASGTNQIKVQPMFLRQKHRNNRVLQVNRKGHKPYIRRQRYSIQPHDIVTVDNKEYEVKTSHCYGEHVKCTDGTNNFDFNIKKIENVFHTNSILLSTISY